MNGEIVVLGFGPQKMDFISKAAKVCGAAAVMDTVAARMAGANFAIGTPGGMAALRQRCQKSAIAAEFAKREGTDLSPAAITWLATGERGVSSETMFGRMTGIRVLGDNHPESHPYDAHDMRRCRLLLEACPELRPALPRVAKASAEWAALITRWDEVCATMNAESPDWRNGVGKGEATNALILSITFIPS